MSDKAKKLFEKDEKVLCFHGSLMYNAKVMDIKLENNEYLYFIHYTGWNKTWDEWVKDSRIYKDDEAGNKFKAEVEKLVKSRKNQKVLRKSDLKKNPEPPIEIIEQLGLSQDILSGNESLKSEEHDRPEEQEDKGSINEPSFKPEEEIVPPPKSVKSSSKRRNRSAAKAASETDEGLLQRSQINVKLTDFLKTFLADDWDLVTKQSRIVNLPSRKPIKVVIEEYLEYSKTKQLPNDHTAYKITQEFREEFVKGIKTNFNCIAGSQLLYKFERPQYGQLMRNNSGKEMTELYGPVHLLRFLVKLKDIITFLKNDKTSLGLIEALAADLVEFLDKNRKQYFTLEDYVGVTPDYLREAMC
ncbi:unnamed protein product [Hymenolepis diminuta]|uniref:MRG domain-containing protein n=1 Tax=Hymenolepis diminuta TaxID=6216 RepID=A0A0R3S994_HYMDI|nr:unnamed protein product [Hymenolepis diminuta]VUZ39183.1 unnamed protein product [Hymenolepis diminuta]